MNIDMILKNIHQGEWMEAEKHINQLIAKGNDEDIYQLAEELASLGFLEEAMKLYLELDRRYPGEGEILFSLAEMSAELGNEEEALLHLENIEESDAIYPSALLLLADIYQGMGMDEVSEQKLLQAKQLVPDEPIVDFAMAELFFEQGKFRVAVELYLDIAKEEKEINGILLAQRIAESLVSKGEFEQSLPYFRQALAENSDINLLFQSGFSAYQAGEYQMAVTWFKELREMDPAYHSLYMYLAKSYQKQNEMGLAMEVAEEGMKEDPYNKELYFYGASLRIKLAQNDKAIDLLKEAIALDPGYMEAVLTLCKTYYLEERHSDTIELISSIRQLGEEDPQFDWLIASSYAELEEFEQAGKYYEAAFDAFADNREFLHEYGYYLLEESRISEAKRIFNMLIKVDPTNDEYLDILDRL